MSETEYKTWWQLHFRAAHQETLTPEERVAYEAGLRELHSEETLHTENYEAEMQAAKAKIADMEQERIRLQAEYRELKARVEALQRARSSQPVGVGES